MTHAVATKAKLLVLLDGIRHGLWGDSALRRTAFLVAGGVAAALTLERGRPAWRLALVGSALLVMILEFMNSAIETALDLLHPAFHRAVERAKDFGSVSVFGGAVLCFSVWWTWAESALRRWRRRAAGREGWGGSAAAATRRRSGPRPRPIAPCTFRGARARRGQCASVSKGI